MWFPNLSKLTKKFVETCHPGCSSVEGRVTPAPQTPRKTPDGPWKVVQADFKGPIGGPCGYYFHAMVNTYSRWLDVHVTKNTSFKKLAPVLNNTFVNHGVPEVIIHDGGPPYTSNEWTKYAQETGFKSPWSSSV